MMALRSPVMGMALMLEHDVDVSGLSLELRLMIGLRLAIAVC
jgi:hypothetical protein